MTIEELSSLYARTQAAFDEARETLDMTSAIALQSEFDIALAQYKIDNPDDLLFIDFMGRQITIRPAVIQDIEDATLDYLTDDDDVDNP